MDLEFPAFFFALILFTSEFSTPNLFLPPRGALFGDDFLVAVFFESEGFDFLNADFFTDARLGDLFTVFFSPPVFAVDFLGEDFFAADLGLRWVDFDGVPRFLDFLPLEVLRLVDRCFVMFL